MGCKASRRPQEGLDVFEEKSEASSLTMEYPRSKGVVYRYGTAGFRSDAKILDSVMLRMGMLAALRARLKPSKSIGIMVTASHNKEKDNGVKIADFDGGMLEAKWEPIATEIANCTENQLMNMFRELVEKENINMSVKPTVYIGEDTRESSPKLADLVEKGAICMGASVLRFKECTTPQLHYLVWSHNTRKPTDLKGYCQEISKAFLSLCDSLDSKSSFPELHVDCANGVGAIAMAQIAPMLEKCLKIKLFNTDTKSSGKLNENCGAEHVQKAKKLPVGISNEGPHCSLDGDSDRIVFFYPDEKEALGYRLQDGDKIASLIVITLRDILNTSKLINGVKLGVVQTAYANGASTKYLKTQLGEKGVLCAKTGVKHLHHKALALDVGVYFEANGHGTVLFSQPFLQKLSAAVPKDPEEKKAVRKLRLLVKLINQAIGDAISDLLVVVYALRVNNWSVSQWDSIYQDYPSRMLKVKVKDRTMVRTTDAERKCVAPEGLQKRIDDLVAEMGQDARSFVRPSGTEDVVRIYAEATTQKDADELADKVKAMVSEMLG
ncbi:hypothetical protein AAMO2058_001183400 [Amorphochlora amoebiformis]